METHHDITERRLADAWAELQAHADNGHPLQAGGGRGHRADLAGDERLMENVALAKVAEVVPFEYDPVQPPPEMYDMWADALNRIVLEGETVTASLATLNEQVQGLIDQGLADNLV